jgi:hypothetical protein
LATFFGNLYLLAQRDFNVWVVECLILQIHNLFPVKFILFCNKLQLRRFTYDRIVLDNPKTYTLRIINIV